MQTAAGGPISINNNGSDRDNYQQWLKLSPTQKLKRRINIAKTQFNQSSSPIYNSLKAIFGGYDPENPDLITGEPNVLPSRGVNPKTVQNVAKGVRTLEDYLKTTKVTAQALEGSSIARSAYATDRYIGGRLFQNTLPEEAMKIQGHGMAKSPTIQDALARLRYILDNGIKGKFYTAPLKVSKEAAMAGEAIGTGGATPYFDGHFLITGKPDQMINSVDDIGTIYINDAYENEEALKAAQKLQKYLQQTYPKINFKLYSQGFKQGGKMNILEFLKNGSGIHIKEKNKGKFTSYCGGKVTDECIQKGKNSSNPAIRKRATFAANARKWKHQDGGIIIAEKGIKAGQKAKQNLTKRKAPDWDNLDRGYRYLTQDMKLPHDQAIAIMGNVVEESQGNYKAAQKNGGGRGLIQWDGQPTPTGRYGQWGKIWASVAKPANVYDSKTDTMKNYWAPWGGLKGEQVRQKFINAPLKTKTKIYAESYLRPGNPRIKDRQLSAMQLDSIYNPRIKNIIIDKEGGIIKAEDGTKFNWQSALTNMGTNLFNSYLQSKVQNNKINSEAEATKAGNEIDLNQYFLDIYQQELAKAQQEEDQKNKAISAMNDTVINSSPLVTQKIAYDKASKSYGNQKANQDARNKAIDEQAKAAKSSVITDAVSGVIQNGLGMLKDYYGSKNNNTSITNTSNSYFDNYVNTKYKKFGTFNPDGSMNMLGGTFTIKDGYKPNQPQLFNYQPLKLNV